MPGKSIGPQHHNAGSPVPGINQIQAEFSGPLPHPNTLARYNEVIPNGAERIMTMAEKQSAHREDIETRVVEENLANQKRGSYFAFILSLTAIGGFLLIYAGKSAEGPAAIITSVTALAGVFFYAKHAQKQERIQKAAAIEARKRP